MCGSALRTCLIGGVFYSTNRYLVTEQTDISLFKQRFACCHRLIFRAIQRSAPQDKRWSFSQVTPTAMSGRLLRGNKNYVTREEFVSFQRKIEGMLLCLGIESDASSTCPHVKVTDLASSGDCSGFRPRNPSCGTNSTASTASSMIECEDEVRNPSGDSSSVASSENLWKTLGTILKNQEGIRRKLTEISNKRPEVQSENRESESEKSPTSRDQVAREAFSNTEDLSSLRRQTMVLNIEEFSLKRAQGIQPKSKRYFFQDFPGFVFFLLVQLTESALSISLYHEPEDRRNPPIYLPEFFAQLKLKVVLKVLGKDGEMDVLSSKPIELKKVSDQLKLVTMAISGAKEKGYLVNDEITVFCVFEYSWQFD